MPIQFQLGSRVATLPGHIASNFSNAVVQSQMDDSWDCACQTPLTLASFIFDELGLHWLGDHQLEDLYEFVPNHRRSCSFHISRNRTVDESLSRFGDHILGDRFLDRLPNASCQMVMKRTR